MTRVATLPNISFPSHIYLHFTAQSCLRSNGRLDSAVKIPEAIAALALSPDGKYLAAGDAGGRVVLISD